MEIEIKNNNISPTIHEEWKHEISKWYKQEIIIIKYKYSERNLKKYLLERLKQWILIVKFNKIFQVLIKEYQHITRGF